jgi:glutathione S-transferase
MTMAIVFMVSVSMNSSSSISNSHLFLESRAIGRYIALKYANQGTQGLIPDGSDFEATGRFEEACSVEYSQFNPSAEGLGQELIFKKYCLLLNFSLASKNSLFTIRLRGAETDPAAVAKHTATLEKKLDAYEKILSKRKYLACDVIVFTFAYICDFFGLTLLTLAACHPR